MKLRKRKPRQTANQPAQKQPAKKQPAKKQPAKKQANPTGGTANTAMAQPPHDPLQDALPGNPADVTSFLSTIDADPETEELQLAAYLGFGTRRDLRYFAISWPVLDCLRIFFTLFPAELTWLNTRYLNYMIGVLTMFGPLTPDCCNLIRRQRICTLHIFWK
ncbi:hypothetical protein P170DRAFT_31339 [Aspergillus steynii IBT 23096]|uniref:Uncharacterized protein n=1 Tax=Aspergillus steynii IBT 23096 TaxID=1392250 RepID=A0A2I2GQA0_9EURO|nr:uncharacterized protein P170DRAFT_31339 [Aspergillus steynii IBT 23096]PLB55062.1 hypothetical protein P170DRAFT_31339 [Aspergillus steynii IBT 23096]